MSDPVQAELDAEEMFSSIPEVLPSERQHDGWDGAASVEGHDPVYMPYPHNWDRSRLWCQIVAGMHYNDFAGRVNDSNRPLPGWVIRRALPYLPDRYEDDRFYNDGTPA